jgi:hypothetical protein
MMTSSQVSARKKYCQFPMGSGQQSRYSPRAQVPQQNMITITDVFIVVIIVGMIVYEQWNVSRQ